MATSPLLAAARKSSIAAGFGDEASPSFPAGTSPEGVCSLCARRGGGLVVHRLRRQAEGDQRTQRNGRKQRGLEGGGSGTRPGTREAVSTRSEVPCRRPLADLAVRQGTAVWLTGLTRPKIDRRRISYHLVCRAVPSKARGEAGGCERRRVWGKQAPSVDYSTTSHNQHRACRPPSRHSCPHGRSQPMVSLLSAFGQRTSWSLWGLLFVHPYQYLLSYVTPPAPSAGGGRERATAKTQATVAGQNNEPADRADC